jgi:hypothetical protein
MKKLSAWYLIIISSIYLLMFGLNFIFVIIGYITNTPFLDLQPSMQIVGVLGIGLCFSLSFLALKSGLRIIRKDKPREIIPYSQQLNLHLSGRIVYNDYRNLILSLSFNPINWTLIIMIGPMYSIMYSNSVSSEVKLLIPIGILLFFFLIVGTTLRSIKKQYRDSAYLQHQLHYTLENATFRIHGETFDSTLQWTHFTKVKETKNFFLFFQGRVANFIPKNMFSETELIEFKSFINSLNISAT